MARAAIWARVSTDQQDTANQVDQLRAWCDRRGMEVVAAYEVQESAWKGEHLRQLSEVYQDARGHKFDTFWWCGRWTD